MTCPGQVINTANPLANVACYGNDSTIRSSVGVGLIWNSPFGPFRLDFAHVLLKKDGDDTKTFTFNVGTQF